MSDRIVELSDMDPLTKADSWLAVRALLQAANNTRNVHP